MKMEVDPCSHQGVSTLKQVRVSPSPNGLQLANFVNRFNSKGGYRSFPASPPKAAIRHAHFDPLHEPIINSRGWKFKQKATTTDHHSSQQPADLQIIIIDQIQRRDDYEQRQQTTAMMVGTVEIAFLQSTIINKQNNKHHSLSVR